MKILLYFILTSFLFLTGCLDTDGEIQGVSENDSTEVTLNPADILPGVLNPGVLIGDIAQLPAPLNGGCNANEILEWDGGAWRCVPTPSVAGGVATTVPASGVQPGTFQPNVLLPADQITAGAFGAGVTIPSTQITNLCANNQILQSNGSGNFVCANLPTFSAPVASVYGRTGAVVATAGDYTGSLITNVPAGNIAATTTQAAINELDSEKLALAGGTMTGDIATGGNEITGLPATPSGATAAASRAYVDAQIASVSGPADNLGNHTATTNLDLADNLLVGNGGSSGIAIDGAGNVGVGTSSPDSRLSVVKGGIGDQGLVQFQLGQDDGSARDFIIRKDTSAPYGVEIIGAANPVTDAGFMAFKTSDQTSGEKMRITASGNVGIGTTNPTSALFVQAPTDTTLSGTTYGTQNRMTSSPTADAGGSSYANLSFTTKTGAFAKPTVAGGYQLATNTGTGAVTVLQGSLNQASNSGTGVVANARGAYGTTSNNGPGSITLARGVLGIATASTDAAGSITTARGGDFQVTATAGSITTAQAGYFDTGISGTGTIATGYGVFIADIAGTNDFGVYQSAANDTNYFAGEVGIGTDSPNVELDVNTGTINAASICDENNANCIDLSAGVAAKSIRRLASEPSSGLVSGDVYYNTTDSTTYVFNGANFEPMASSGDSNSVISNSDPTTNLTGATAGDIAFNSTSDELEYFDGTNWVSTNTPATGDDLGDHIVDQNLRLGSNYLSGDGGAEGIRVDTSGRVGVGTSAAALTHALEVVSGTNLIRAADSSSNVALTVENPTGNLGGGVTLKADGSVGIGDATPSARLDVRALDTSTDDALRLTTNANNADILMSSTGTIAAEANIYINMDADNNDADTRIISFGKNAKGSTGDTELMRIAETGNVAIGTTTADDTLVVDGVIRTRIARSKGAAASTIDFSDGNMQMTTGNCKAFNLHNLRDGGAYMFAVQGTTVATCSFNIFSDAGTTALTVHLPPDHGPTTAGTHTVYNFAVLGTHVYIAWTPGY